MRKIIVTVEDTEINKFSTNSIELIRDDLINNPSQLIHMIHLLEQELDNVKANTNL